MKKNGFTLVELLGVIAILALLATVATPAIISISNKIKENMYDTKVKLIKETAVLYAEKYNYNSTDVKKLNELCLHKVCYNVSCTSYSEENLINPDDKLSKYDCLNNPVKNKPMGGVCYFKIDKKNGRYKITFPVNKNGILITDPNSPCTAN